MYDSVNIHIINKYFQMYGVWMYLACIYSFIYKHMFVILCGVYNVWWCNKINLSISTPPKGWLVDIPRALSPPMYKCAQNYLYK